MLVVAAELLGCKYKQECGKRVEFRDSVTALGCGSFLV